jgi:hypothetical protein
MRSGVSAQHGTAQGYLPMPKTFFQNPRLRCCGAGASAGGI